MLEERHRSQWMMQRAIQVHVLHAKQQAIHRWQLFANQRQLTAARTKLVRLSILRPYLRTFRLHALYRGYRRRMRSIGQEYRLRRLGGITELDWIGRAEAYRVGKQPMPTELQALLTAGKPLTSSLAKLSEQQHGGARQQVVGAASVASNRPGHVLSSAAGLHQTMPTFASMAKDTGAFFSTVFTGHSSRSRSPPSRQPASCISAATHVQPSSLQKQSLSSSHSDSHGQVYPIDHRREISAFPRSDFVQLPMKASSRSLREAVKGLQAPMLPRPDSMQVPDWYIGSEAQQAAWNDNHVERTLPLHLQLPLPPVIAEPSLHFTTIPTSHATTTTSSSPATAIALDASLTRTLHRPAPRMHQSTSTAFHDTSAQRLPPFAASAIEPLHASSFGSSSLPFSSTLPLPLPRSAMPTSSSAATSGRPVSPFRSSLLSMRTPLEPPTSSSEIATAVVLTSPLRSKANAHLDPTAQRRSNRQKLQVMLQLSQLPHAHSTRTRPQPRQRGVDLELAGAVLLSSSWTGVDHDDDELADGNYRNEQLSKLHAQLSMLRRHMMAWYEERGKKRLCQCNLQTNSTHHEFDCDRPLTCANA